MYETHLGVKWEKHKLVFALKHLCIGLIHCHRVLTAFEYFNFIGKFISTTTKVSFSTDSDCRVNTITTILCCC